MKEKKETENSQKENEKYAREQYQEKHKDRHEERREQDRRSRQQQSQQRERRRSETGPKWADSNNKAKQADMSAMHLSTLFGFVDTSLRSNFNIDYEKAYNVMADKILSLSRRIKNKSQATDLSSKINTFIYIVKRINPKTKENLFTKGLPVIMLLNIKLKIYFPDVDYAEKAKKQWGI